MYSNSKDDRILEYDAEAILFEEVSPYQKVQIMKTKSFGNLLVLDGLQSKYTLLSVSWDDITTIGSK